MKSLERSQSSNKAIVSILVYLWVCIAAVSVLALSWASLVV